MTRGGLVTTLGGMMMLLSCALFLYFSLDYGLGNLRRMRAGYFPVVLASAGLIVGATLLVMGFFSRDREKESFIPIPVRPLVCTLAAIGCFALLIRPWGLLPAVVASTLISAIGYRENRITDLVLVTLGAAVFCGFVFVYLLGLPIPLFRGVW